MEIPLPQLNQTGRLYTQALLSREYLNMDAIFSDETKYYVSPYDPLPGETVTIKLRTAKNNTDSVFLMFDGGESDCEDKDRLENKPEERAADESCGSPPRRACVKRIKMEKTETDGLFDYYTADVRMPGTPSPEAKITHAPVFRYYFAVVKNEKTYFYNKRGLYENADSRYHFRVVPGFRTPDWAKGAVMYQIFVDRFYNGDPTNDPLNYEYIYLGRPSRSMDWDSAVVPDDICNFYGGDLRGVMEKMAYLKSLGIDAIYFNPLFVSPSNHKYDTQDYDYVDPHIGCIVNDDGNALTFEKFNNRYATKYMSRTADQANLEASNKLLIELIELAHENGIKVILDGVFNHCGSYNKWLDKAGFYHLMGYPDGAYRSAGSRYNSYFLWYDNHWPNNDCYDGWWGNENHPKLNYENSPELYEYIMGIARKWVSPPYNADGWRLDVAADLGRSSSFNHKFWRDFRRVVKDANPEAIIIAEHYGDVTPWISGGEWDTLMNYDAFMSPLTWFLTGMNKHSEEYKPELACNSMVFEETMRYCMSWFNIHSLQTAMNQLSNHDHSRFLTRTNRTAGRLHTHGTHAAAQNVNKSIMMEAVVFQMTWPGAPTLYYGDEAGMAGWTDPDNRRPFPWGAEDEEMMSLHRAAIALRHKYSALRTGSLEFLWNSYGILSYGRWNDTERIAVVLNNNPEPRHIRVPVWKIGCAEGCMETLLCVNDENINLDKTSTDVICYNITEGIVELSVPQYGSVVLVYKNL